MDADKVGGTESDSTGESVEKAVRHFTRKPRPVLMRFHPMEFEHLRYHPVEKSIIGRVWSKVRFSTWMDNQSHEQAKAEFKLFIRSGVEKYRCEALFHQAYEALNLQKGDWIRVTGGDYMVQTVSQKKVYHNFKITKIEILPNGYGMIDWRPLWEMYEDLLESYADLTTRVTELERMCGITDDDSEMRTKRDNRMVKKWQSLKPILGDIYTDTEFDEGDEDDDDDE